MKNNLGIFIQARMGSTRLPGKILKIIGQRPALKILTDNLQTTEFKDNLFLLTSTNTKDDIVKNFAINENIKFFRGSEYDVLDRYFRAAQKYFIQDIVRLTGDCPFLSIEILKKNIYRYYELNKPDYYFIKGYPNGIGAVEIFSFDALKHMHKEATTLYHREHVITYMEDNPHKFKIVTENAQKKYNRPDIRLTLDEPDDLKFLRVIYSQLNGQIDIDNIFRLLTVKPELLKINKHIKQKTR